MAKRLFLLAAGAIALTACTSEDVVKDVYSSRNVIEFQNVVNKHTRAELTEDLTGDGLREFNVFGFYTLPANEKHAHQVFYNTPVSRTDKDAAWDYKSTYGERYWIPGAKYYFYAYSCGNKPIMEEKVPDIDYTLDMTNEGEGKDASERVLQIQNYICDNDHQHDLIFASNTDGIEGKDGTEKNDDVPLTFSHLLAKVSAKFTTKFPTEYQIVVRNISIENLRDKGNFDPDNRWQDIERSSTPSKSLELPGVPNDTDDEDGNFQYFVVKNTGDAKNPMSITTHSVYVLPYEYEDTDDDRLNLIFTIDVYIDEDRTERVMSKTLKGKLTPNWEEGYQYIYNIDINGDTTKMNVISFTTAVNEFGEPENIDEPTDFEVTDNDVSNDNN